MSRGVTFTKRPLSAMPVGEVIVSVMFEIMKLMKNLT